ncbi:vesicle-associated protein 2-1-like isoform X2 [Trifolium pratense]|uniref:vesicle-associated protein 2-1-like isoform X2 n=1 Tax=Trifolium pratense TaxID=57577 RepID=UPI001E695EC0|nr:vesicle-associated protein 2-1-like isoform X2 [Trifolium pratense]
MTTASIGNSFITINPPELRFQFELEQQTFCDLKVSNKTEYFVAFKVKTTSPKKYFVRPNTGVIHPWDSCIIRVTLQAQQEYPPNMQCKDKFLIQTTTLDSNTDVDDLPPDTFNKDSGKLTEELKLRVVYVSPNSPQGSTSDDTKYSAQKLDTYSSQTLQQLKEERDAAARETRQLQQELDMLKRRRNRRSDPGLSFTFAMFVGLIGILFGFLLKLSLSLPPTQ